MSTWQAHIQSSWKPISNFRAAELTKIERRTCCSGHFQFVIFVSFHHGAVSMHASPLLMCWKRVFKKNKQSSPKRIFVFFLYIWARNPLLWVHSASQNAPKFCSFKITMWALNLQGLRFCKENVPQCSTHVQCNHLFDNSHKGFPLLKLCRKAVNIYIYMQGKSNNHDERHSLFSDANILFKHALLPDWSQFCPWLRKIPMNQKHVTFFCMTMTRKKNRWTQRFAGSPWNATTTHFPMPQAVSNSTP